MAKHDNKQVMAGANQGRADSSGQFDAFLRRTQGRSDELYNNTNDTGGAREAYKNFSDTGGLDEGDVGKLRGVYDNLKAPDTSAIKAGYQGLADTGGYSAADVGNIRARSASSAPAFYSALKQDMDQQRLVSGNKAGAGATNFKLARQQAQQANQDRIGTEIGLSDSIRSGKFSGLQGLESLSNTEGQFGLSKAAGQSGVESGIMGARQQGKQFGASGLGDLYHSNLSAGDSLNSQQLSALSQKFGIDQGYLQQLMAAKGTGIDWGKIASAGAGIATGFLTGGSSLAAKKLGAGSMKGFNF